jgi:hypothetical protein
MEKRVCEMPTSTVRASFLVFAVCLAYGQTVEKPVSFDAASIKPHSDAEEGSITPPGGSKSRRKAEAEARRSEAAVCPLSQEW